MTRKPEIKPYVEDDEPQTEEAVSNRAAIAQRYPALLVSGVVLPDGTFRTGHLDYVVTQWRNNPGLAELHFADDLAYIREAMPGELK